MEGESAHEEINDGKIRLCHSSLTPAVLLPVMLSRISDDPSSWQCKTAATRASSSQMQGRTHESVTENKRREQTEKLMVVLLAAPNPSCLGI